MILEDCSKILILVLILVSRTSVLHITQNNTVLVLIRLMDNTPLTNATVKICIGLSTNCKSNITDNNGFTIIELTSTSTFLRTYVEYGVYGEIYYRGVEYSGGNTIDLIIPFKKLSIEYNITDEYLKPIVGIYKLYYKDKLLITGDFNGEITINESSHPESFLLINTRKPTESIYERIAGIEYSLEIQLNEETRQFRVHYENVLKNILLIDLHKPVIELLNITINYIPNIQIPVQARVYVDLNISDGLETSKISIRASYRWNSGEENSRVEISLVENRDFSAVYRIAFSTYLYSEYRDQLITLKTIVTDQSGKSSELVEHIDVWSSIKKSNGEEPVNTTLSNQLPNQSIYTNTSTSPGTITNETISGEMSGFEIAVKDSIYSIINYIYFLGLFISLIILIKELKRYHREHSGSS